MSQSNTNLFMDEDEVELDIMKMDTDRILENNLRKTEQLDKKLQQSKRIIENLEEKLRTSEEKVQSMQEDEQEMIEVQKTLEMQVRHFKETNA